MSMNCLFLNIFSFMLLNINILCIERQFHTLEQIAKNFPMMISNYQKYPVFEFNLSNNINIMLQNISTFFLNLFYAGMMKAMPPVLRNDKDDLTVIRPLIYCREKDLITLSKIKQYPIMPKGLCGWGEDQERASMSKMIKSWDKDHPKRADIVFKALKNVAPSHLLDKNLFDFSKITNGSKVK